MNETMGAPRIAVIVATSNRISMLSQRSLPSVVAQTRAPDFLVVVDDSDCDARPANATFVGNLSLCGCEVSYLENERTAGASGTWNTALDFLAAKGGDLSNVFVGILDDDDCWCPEYLENCAAAVASNGLDMVACGIRRIDGGASAPLVVEAPESLRPGDFLVGNPGIQGSNLYVRLSVLLAAGGFDEGLPSATDRDICIRIADLGSVRYARISAALVNHFADSDRIRLSTRGSATKLAGLTAFWRKYIGRMTIEERKGFLNRADALFGWRPPTDMVFDLQASGAPRRVLVLGLIADHWNPATLLEAARKLANWQTDTLGGLDVVLLEKGRASEATASIDQAVAVLRDSGVGCFRLSLDPNDLDGGSAQFLFGAGVPGRDADVSNETLRLCCTRVAEGRGRAEVWFAEGHDCIGPAPQGFLTSEVLCWLHATQAGTDSPATSRANSTATNAFDRWFQLERAANAGHVLRWRFSLDRLRLLGSGSEAVVLTDERTVFKCIDNWADRMPLGQLDFLRGQVGRWTEATGLYVLREVAEIGSWAVIIYDFEASTPYEGGHEADLLRLLDGCCIAGVVCNNVHPKNLVVAKSGVMLIDYGSDIRPWSPLGFEHMARRAFLAHKHAAHPELQLLMRRALSDDQLPEMAGYSSFRAQVDGALRHREFSLTPAVSIAKAPPHPPFQLYVGVATSDPLMVKGFLDSLVDLAASVALRGLAVVVLANACPAEELGAVVQRCRNAGLNIAVVDEARQRLDAAAGGFGPDLRDRPQGQVGIARARTMLQRYLGALLVQDAGSYGWILDDDMRVDARALAYLPWLPAFREQGVDVLIGAYEGSSPNPPINGLRVHLVDLLHNVHWLRGLPGDLVLPDRTAENAAHRARWPDYYYDLSRKHTAHLETPHWLEPAFPGETVREAYSRLLNGAVSLLDGAPLTRPIIAGPSWDPLTSAKDSVNRGGCTFILNHRAVSETPNTITSIHGREARRSDMVWAIVNRHHRRMAVKAVAFPIRHLGRVNAIPSLNAEKVRGEVVGSTLYAGLTEFLAARPHHNLVFSRAELDDVCDLADLHLVRRWRVFAQNFRRIIGLREAIRSLARPGELHDLLSYLDEWFTPENIERIRRGLSSHDKGEVQGFLTSLRTVADDYARATVNIDFIQAQLRACVPTNAGEGR